ncbi:DUF4868 domain-containing protein [Oceanobacillus caeni]|uniref:Kiwa anti-phage protein KwaB-like domain-containing protein n=1 Tax=Oceanobacillus caeni TaxID=405946 RepID=UPI00195A7D0A|nr:Kiwa anti-phage protein KwaB-like domain-containing protein [Oceanobacillus caeni]MBU8789991.1 DUF4868 domain-containing protein [Oceanobacillus caeni]MCR1834272.1 DUF4868 domain-containing protein [Oceanobacillus caeni]
MSYDLLIEGLEMVKTVKSWSLDVINYNHKSRPYEYTCYSLNFQSDEVLKNTINDMCSKFNSIIDRYGRKVQEYTGANSKNVVDKISVSNKLISKPWDSLIQSLSVSDDYTKLKEIKSKAFIFVGTYNDDSNDQNIYLLSRKNPIYTYKKDRAKIFESRHNKIKEISEPLIQFGKTFDALIYKDTLYTINNNFESIFHMEYSHKVVCKNSLQTIREANVIKDFKSYNSFALSGQHPKKFITFDPRIIDNIQQESNLKILVDELKIPYDYTSKKFDLIDEKQADVFTKAICGKTKYNMFTDGVCEVPNSIPLNLS